jgi:ubiquinone/menaquinone biosynthesis C-methylase UbiE
MKQTRYWDRWDDQGVAEDIDHYWSSDPSGYESMHRGILAQLVQKYLAHPTERMLEVGCGSGLVYKELVPEVIVNSCYVGVDTSWQMLNIARQRFPQGQFIHGDVYSLQFPTNSFDLVACFEVLVHLPEIQTPIAELFRVAARLMMFTVWPSPEAETLNSTEQVRDSEFLHRLYSSDEIITAIRKAAQGEPHKVEIRVLSDSVWAYVVYKGQTAQTAPSQERVLSFPGLTKQLKERFLRQRAVTQAELAARETELKQTRVELVQTQAELEARQAELVQTQAELEARQAELVQTQAELEARQMELAQARNQSKFLSEELDFFRHRRVIVWLRRLRDRSDLSGDISPAFQQLKDDSLIFNSGLNGYCLQPSLNLQRIPFLAYPLELNRPNLTAVLLAPILDFPLSNGVLGVEIVSPTVQIVAQVVVPANRVNKPTPTRFDFSSIPDSDRGRFWLRVFVRDVDAPVRVFEWRKYPLFGLGRLRTRAFCGFLFENTA